MNSILHRAARRFGKPVLEATLPWVEWLTKVVIGDEFLERKGIDHVDVIKIDVEGWELNVLSGLAQTISASRDLTLFCEFNPQAQECAGRGRTELIDYDAFRHAEVVRLTR